MREESKALEELEEAPPAWETESNAGTEDVSRSQMPASFRNAGLDTTFSRSSATPLNMPMIGSFSRPRGPPMSKLKSIAHIPLEHARGVAGLRDPGLDSRSTSGGPASEVDKVEGSTKVFDSAELDSSENDPGGETLPPERVAVDHGVAYL